MRRSSSGPTRHPAPRKGSSRQWSASSTSGGDPPPPLGSRPCTRLTSLPAPPRSEGEWSPCRPSIVPTWSPDCAGCHIAGVTHGTAGAPALRVPYGARRQVANQEVVDRPTRELDLVAGALDDRPKGADPPGKVVADGVEPRATASASTTAALPGPQHRHRAPRRVARPWGAPGVGAPQHASSARRTTVAQCLLRSLT
jgi:hypothetical protein